MRVAFGAREEQIQGAGGGEGGQQQEGRTAERMRDQDGSSRFSEEI
jgi:hypothetical protein